MLLVDTREKSFIQDVEIKTKIARSRPHSEWLKGQVRIIKKSFFCSSDHPSSYIVFFVKNIYLFLSKYVYSCNWMSNFRW